jgi:hypothetical protein
MMQETAVEHVQNARQILANLKGDLQDARATNYAPLVGWLDQVEAADKRLLKVLVQVKNATTSLDTARRALTP